MSATTNTAFDANANANAAAFPNASPALNANTYANASPALNTAAYGSPAMGQGYSTTGPQFVGEVRSAPNAAYVDNSAAYASPAIGQTTYTSVPVGTSAYTTTTMGAYPADQKPSALKGNIEAITGKFQHNPEKVYHGNMMVAQTSEQKAARFEAKALEWEQKGNIAKATKNREKAQRYHLKAANKINAANAAPITAAPKGAVGTSAYGTGAYPVGTTGAYPVGTTGAYPVGTTGAYPVGTTGAYPVGTTGAYPVGTTTYVEGSTYPVGTTGAYPIGTAGAYPVGGAYPAGGAYPVGTGMTTKQMDRVAKFEAKALASERAGNLTRANKNRDKANRVRTKAGVAPIGTYPLSTAVPFANAGPLTSTGVPLTSVQGQVPIATTQPGGYVNSNVGTTTYVQPATVTTTTTTL